MFMCVVNQKSVNKLDLTWKQSFLISVIFSFTFVIFSYTSVIFGFTIVILSFTVVIF